MSTHVRAFIAPTDETYLKHKEIWEVCNKNNVSLPEETEAYFNGCDFPEDKLETKIKAHEWSDNMQRGYEVYIKDLPKGVEKIRFYNSW